MLNGDGQPDDIDGDGVIDESDAIATDTTDDNGAYLFDDLDPADYIIAVAASNFEASGPLANTLPSTPVSTDANDDVDNDNNGAFGPDGLVLSTSVTLNGAEPTGEVGLDNDTGTPDSLSNLTIDFGFWMPTFDLALRKTVAVGQGTATVGDLVTFTIEVFNQGDLAASDVSVVDYLDTNFELADTDWSAGPDSTASITIPGTIPAGMSTTVDITVKVIAVGPLTNTAEITTAIPVDDNGDPVVTPSGELIPDIDSAPDANNDDVLIDDEITLTPGEGDEDDHDRAIITAIEPPVPPPPTIPVTGSDSDGLLNTAMLFLLAGLAAVVAARRKRYATI